jgi:hypothetical protein
VLKNGLRRQAIGPIKEIIEQRPLLVGLDISDNSLDLVNATMELLKTNTTVETLCIRNQVSACACCFITNLCH